MSAQERIEELAAKAVDPEQRLSEEERLELKSLLSKDELAWLRYRRVLDTEVVLRGLDERMDVSDRVMAAIEHAAPRKKSRWVPGVLAAAASLLFCVYAAWLIVDPAEIPRTVYLDGPVQIIRDGESVNPSGLPRLKPGDRVRIPPGGAGGWAFKDGSTIALQAASEFMFAPHLPEVHRGAKRFALYSGRLRGEVTKQHPRRPLVVATAFGQAVVRGTVFHVSARERQARLQVDAGLVELEGMRETLAFKAGESGVAGLKNVQRYAARIPRAAFAYYTFAAGEGALVPERGGSAQGLDLVPSNPASALQWEPEGIRLNGDDFLISQQPAGDFIRACKRAGGLSFEAWVTPEHAKQGGPARIVSLSRSSSLVNAMLAQGGDRGVAEAGWIVRSSTDKREGRRIPSLQSEAGIVKTEITHLVFTLDRGGRRALYVNGELAAADELPGGLDEWVEDIPLAIGGDIESLGDDYHRSWAGVVHFVAIYSAALSAEEVVQNFNAGALQ